MNSQNNHKKLKTIFFKQGEKCFFCGNKITQNERSVEHLIAKSNGGSNDDDNLVVCCKTLNGLFGNIGIKEKIQIILKQPGKFKCPKTTQ
jgi:5-methylcytosine-specific restriction endonuclease McrA